MAHLIVHRQPDPHPTRFDCPADRVTIGRSPSADLIIDDPQVSRVHVVLDQVAGTWFVTDHSSNGTWLDGNRLFTRTALRTTSRLTIGPVLLVFHHPEQSGGPTERGGPPPVDLTPKEREALAHLCLPLLDAVHFADPATVAVIATTMYVSQSRVEQLLNAAARKLGLVGKLERAKLAETAMLAGHITREELAELRQGHDQA